MIRSTWRPITATTSPLPQQKQESVSAGLWTNFQATTEQATPRTQHSARPNRSTACARGLLGFSNFHDFALTVTDQAYLLGAGLDDSNGEFDENVEYDEEDKTETGDQVGRDLYRGSSLSLGPVEGERAGGVSSPENEAGNVVDFQGRQCIDAIPSGTFQVATFTILVHSSHESTLESAIVVFETDNYTPRFVVDKGVPRKV